MGRTGSPASEPRLVCSTETHRAVVSQCVPAAAGASVPANRQKNPSQQQVQLFMSVSCSSTGSLSVCVCVMLSEVGGCSVNPLCSQSLTSSSLPSAPSAADAPALVTPAEPPLAPPAPSPSVEALCSSPSKRSWRAAAKPTGHPCKKHPNTHLLLRSPQRPHTFILYL